MQSLAVTPDPDQYDPMAEIWWTLAMALAWIIFRTSHAVRQAWWAYRGEFRIWSDLREIEVIRDGHREICMGYELLRSYDLSVGEISRQYFYNRVGDTAVMVGEDALSSLWRNLESGQLIAEGVRNGKARAPIRDAEWIDLRAFRLEGWPADSIGADEETPRFFAVRIRSSRVLELWPSSTLVEAITGPDRRSAQQERRAAVRQAFKELWPDGTPLGFMVQQRDVKIIDWFKTRELHPPSGRTISRALKGVAE